MHVLTAVTNPHNSHQWLFFHALVLNYCSQRRINLLHFQWLTYEKAGDFYLEIPDHEVGGFSSMLRAESESRNLEFDLVLQHEDTRSKKLLVADMEATIIEQEMMDELAVILGVDSEVKALTSLAMQGKLDFYDSFMQRVKLLKGLHSSHLFSLCSCITLSKGAMTLIKTLESKACRTVLITSGLSVFAQHVMEKCGFSAYFANQIGVCNGEMSGQVLGDVIGRDEKASIALNYAADLNILPSEVCAVGDGANDKSMLKESGLAIGHHPKLSLLEDCDLVIKHTDLTAILYAQGFRENEFVTG